MQMNYNGNPEQAAFVLCQTYESLKRILYEHNRPIGVSAYMNAAPNAIAPVYYTTSHHPPIDVVLKPIVEALERYLGYWQPLYEQPEFVEPLPKLDIIVEGGEVFEGNEEQWADCFFSNVTVEGVEEFCKQNGWEVEITRRS
jgi:hypothetical protein